MVQKSFFFFFVMLQLCRLGLAHVPGGCLYQLCFLQAGILCQAATQQLLRASTAEASDRQFIARCTVCYKKSQIWAICKAQGSLSLYKSLLQGEKIRAFGNNAFPAVFCISAHSPNAVKIGAERRVLRPISPARKVRCLHSFIHFFFFNVSSKSQ